MEKALVLRHSTYGKDSTQVYIPETIPICAYSTYHGRPPNKIRRTINFGCLTFAVVESL